MLFRVHPTRGGHFEIGEVRLELGWLRRGTLTLTLAQFADCSYKFTTLDTSHVIVQKGTKPIRPLHSLSLVKMEKLGIDPNTSRMLSGRSTI